MPKWNRNPRGPGPRIDGTNIKGSGPDHMRGRKAMPLRSYLVAALPHTTGEVWREAALEAAAGRPAGGVVMCPQCGHTAKRSSDRDVLTGLCVGRKSCAVRRSELDNETITALGLIPLPHGELT